jgi:hypothetical protein
MAIDYGVEYATILPNGQILLDLSPIRVTGPMVPVIRVARAWVETLRGALEKTYQSSQLGALRASLTAAGLEVDHVLVIDPVEAALGADKGLRASGACYVGGSRAYPLNVTIGKLGEAIASVSQ